MDLEAAVFGRRSIRQFTDDPVTEEMVRDVLDLARWAPSWANTQSWSVFAVMGQTLDEIRAAYRQRKCAKAERHFEIPRPHPEWPPEMAARTRQLVDARTRSGGAGTLAPATEDFFGAPCLLLFAIDRRLQAEYACFDTGLLVQTVCLAAHARGLGTCIMAMAVGYPDVLHELLPSAEGKRFVVGVALGVPDRDAAVNRFERQRAEIADWASFVA